MLTFGGGGQRVGRPWPVRAPISMKWVAKQKKKETSPVDPSAQSKIAGLLFPLASVDRVEFVEQ